MFSPLAPAKDTPIVKFQITPPSATYSPPLYLSATHTPPLHSLCSPSPPPLCSPSSSTTSAAPPPPHPLQLLPLHILLQMGILAHCVSQAADAVGPSAQGGAGSRLAASAAHIVAVTAGRVRQQTAGGWVTALVHPSTKVRAKVTLLFVLHQAVSTEPRRCG